LWPPFPDEKIGNLCFEIVQHRPEEIATQIHSMQSPEHDIVVSTSEAALLNTNALEISRVSPVEAQDIFRIYHSSTPL
jgi:hypothetical protein